MLFLVAVILVLIVSLYWLGTYNFAVVKSFNIPGPKLWPFVGNIPDIFKYGGIENMILEYRKRFGTVFYISLGQEPCIVIADPDLIKLVTVKEFDKFRNRNNVTELPPPNNSGVGSAKDGDWKRIRSTLTPTFSGSKMKQMVPILEESCEILMGKFRNAADSGQTVNVDSYFKQYVLEVLLKSAFGMNSNVQTEPNQEIVSKVKRFITNSNPVRMVFQSLPCYALAMKLLSRVMAGKYFKYFNDIAMGIITHRKEQGIASGRKDLMHLMLNTTDKDGKRKLTDDEISAQSVMFLIAGLESSSSTLSITSFCLAHHPELQEKLNEEIDGSLASYPDKPIYDVIQDLEYLDCVFNESLRVPMTGGFLFLHRKCSETCTLNGVHFPSGIGIYTCYTLLHHDPDAWDDPFKFDPERHRGPVKDKRHPYQFCPFGAGPRNCIGMRLAQLNVKFTLVRLLREFRFVLAPETEAISPIFKRPGAVELRVEYRNK